MENTSLPNTLGNYLTSERPSKVSILLATHNGVQWISQQIHSIINQDSVETTLFISDDLSRDGTYNLINWHSEHGTQIKVLPNKIQFGSAGKNFYRLIQDVDCESFDYVAFSDQDDIWQPNKLIRHIEIAKQEGADGVSSNVKAFWPNGKQKYLQKSQPQRQLDFLFESAGPGCTFLMTTRLINLVRKQLLKHDNPAKNVTLHDWLCYAICRSNGFKWIIDHEPSVLYRQHGTNQVGANVGVKAKLNRLIKLKSSWYRNEVIKVAEVCQQINFSTNVAELLYLLKNKNFTNQLKLLKFIPQARRKFVDRMVLAGTIITGIF